MRPTKYTGRQVFWYVPIGFEDKVGKDYVVPIRSTMSSDIRNALMIRRNVPCLMR